MVLQSLQQTRAEVDLRRAHGEFGVLHASSDVGHQILQQTGYHFQRFRVTQC